MTGTASPSLAHRAEWSGYGLQQHRERPQAFAALTEGFVALRIPSSFERATDLAFRGGCFDPFGRDLRNPGGPQSIAGSVA